MDKKVPTANSHHSKMMQRLEPLMKSLQLVDVWRWCYPFWCFHTCKIKNSFSRLDYFFVQEELLCYVQTCEIANVFKNDHLPVSLHLNNGGQGLNNGPGPAACTKVGVGCTKICRLISEKSHSGLHKYNVSDESKKHVTTHDIAKAINRLQVSETKRQDGIQASMYKENLKNSDLLKYLQRLYNSILDGTSFPGFSSAISYDRVFHIFNVDYIILASILARRLDKALKSLTDTRLNKEKPAAVIYCFQEVPQSVEQSVLEKALATLSPSPDVRVSCKILLKVSENYLLRQGCPLTSSLHSLLLTYAAVKDLKSHVSTELQDVKRFKEQANDLESLKKHVRIQVHKNFTLCVPLKNLKKKVEEIFHTCYDPQIIKESNCLTVMKRVPVTVLHAKGYKSNDDPLWCPRLPCCSGQPLCPGPPHHPDLKLCEVCCPGPPLRHGSICCPDPHLRPDPSL